MADERSRHGFENRRGHVARAWPHEESIRRLESRGYWHLHGWRIFNGSDEDNDFAKGFGGG